MDCERASLVIDPSELTLQVVCLLDEELHLLLIAPAEDKGAPVVDASRVVLVVTSAPRLHLPLLRHRPLGPPELLHRLGELMPGSRHELTFQPRRKRPALYLNDPVQGVRRRISSCSRGGAKIGGHPVVDEPGAEVAIVDPLRCRRVVLLRHEQGEPEAPKHALGDALPGSVLVPDLKQFTGKGQLVLGDLELVAHPRPHVKALTRQVTATGLQAEELLVHLAALVSHSTPFNGELLNAVLGLGELLAHSDERGREERPHIIELFRGRDRREFGPSEKFGGLLESCPPGHPLEVGLGDRLLNLTDAVTAKAGTLHFESLPIGVKGHDLRIDFRQRPTPRLNGGVQGCNRCIEQPDLQPRSVAGKAIPLGCHRSDLVLDAGEFITLLEQWRELCQLGARA